MYNWAKAKIGLREDGQCMQYGILSWKGHCGLILV
jgi:hypothetical protein